MFSELYKKIDYKFKDEKLLKEALTHPSANEGLNYERLEFLGDSVLTLVISDILIQKFQNESEGDLAKRRAAVINGRILSEIATKLKLPEYIVLSSSEEHSGGRKNTKILENTLEALIGALYIDSGLDFVSSFIKQYWTPIIEKHASPPVDDKTYLQEWAQSQGYRLPEYKILSKEGPDHNPNFVVEVEVQNLPIFKGKGNSKKDAEKSAASNIVKYIKQNEPKN